LGERITATMARLQQAVAGGDDALAQARALQAEMATLIARLNDQRFGPTELRGVLAALVDEGLTGEFRDYAGAEQATMAIGSVANFMYQKGVLKSASAINVGLAELQATVANDERYSPARFEAALRSFRGAAGL
jgi:hypothetical protein